MSSWRRLLQELYSRIQAWLQTSSAGTIQLTGVLGLALVVAGYYHIRGGRPGDDQARRRRAGDAGAATAAQAGSSGAALLPAPPSSSLRPDAPRQSSAAADAASTRAADALKAAAARPAASIPARAVQDKLIGVKRITVSVPGVLLQEWQAHQLQDAATVRPEAAALLCEAARTSMLYLVAHVVDDIGQAAVSGALEAVGLVGSGVGQVPAHRLLFCSSLEVRCVACLTSLEWLRDEATCAICWHGAHIALRLTDRLRLYLSSEGSVLRCLS